METAGLALLGLIFGSFYTVVTARVPEGRSIVTPPSSCPACGHRLGPLDLIPAVSFLVQGAKCRYCGTAIPWRYFWIEAGSGLAFAAARLISGGDWRLTVAGIVLFSFLLVLTVVDLERMLLPDRLTIPGIAAGVVLAAAGWSYVSLNRSLLGAAAGYGVMWLIRLAARGAMGGGDVKLLALIGAFLGPVEAVRSLFWASAAGSAVGLLLILARRHRRGQPLPFGPFLALGALVSLVTRS